MWMAAKTPPSAGVMTISHGSAQYVFAFYAHHNAYPFGRFNLATVLPGGRIIQASAPAPGARTPRDWINRWPPPLIASGQISYLVYYTTAADDPPAESQVVEASTQRQFRLLIERYGGELVHTVYYNHEGRAWIYRLTARQPHPVLSSTVRGSTVTLHGAGFTEGAALTATYNGKQVARGRADAAGAVTLPLALPTLIRPRYLIVVTDSTGRHWQLVVKDGAGNNGSLKLLKPALTARISGNRVTVQGSGYPPGGLVTAIYHGRFMTSTKADSHGSITLAFPLPAGAQSRWLLFVRDTADHFTTIIHPRSHR